MIDSFSKRLRDGEPCDHPGCLSYLSRPCESCGRIGGKGIAFDPAFKRYPDGHIELVEISIVPADKLENKFIKDCNESLADICRVFQVPADLLRGKRHEN